MQLLSPVPAVLLHKSLVPELLPHRSVYVSPSVSMSFAPVVVMLIVVPCFAVVGVAVTDVSVGSWFGIVCVVGVLFTVSSPSVHSIMIILS